MHSVAPPKSKAIVLLREKVDEIFSNVLHYMLLGMIIKICKFKKKFCRADESKNLLFDNCFFNIFPSYRIFKKLVYIRIQLIFVFTKNLKKIHRPEAEILAHKDRKYEKVTDNYACAKLFTRAQSSSYACETTGFYPDVFFVKRRSFSF